MDGMTRTADERRPPRAVRRVLPGLTVAAAAAILAYGVNVLLPVASPLLLTLLAGMLVGNVGANRPRWEAGLRFAGRPVLRAGVALLGLQLAVGGLLGLGAGVVVTVLVAVGLTFPATMWIGTRLGLPPARALLVSTGLSICGASAVVAMNEVAEGDEDDVAVALATVTVLGTLAIGVFPVLDVALGLNPLAYGAWAGSSVHEVGQVVAIGGAAGATALQAAVAVKLGRVILLAPLVAAVALYRRRPGRLPSVPWFVVAFAALVAVRSTGWLPDGAVRAAGVLANVLLAAALFALGTGVDLRAVARGGGRAMVTGALGTLLLMAVALGGLVLVG
jgi:uncharacterized integral membrane protein (TIGR00698 family)